MHTKPTLQLAANSQGTAGTVSHAKLFRYHANVAKTHTHSERGVSRTDTRCCGSTLFFKNRHVFPYSCKVLADKASVRFVAFNQSCCVWSVSGCVIFTQSSDVMQVKVWFVLSLVCPPACLLLINWHLFIDQQRFGQISRVYLPSSSDAYRRLFNKPSSKTNPPHDIRSVQWTKV